MAESKRTVRHELGRTDSCPECGSEDLIHDFEKEEIYCQECGLVLSKFVTIAEYDERTKAESGKNPTLGNFDRTLQTYVGDRKGEAENKRSRKLKKSNMSLRYKDVNQTRTDGILEIQKLTSVLSLPDFIRENSIIVFSNIQEDNFCSGSKALTEVVGAVIYWSCREYRFPRTVGEISSFLGEKESRINKIYLEICKKLETGHLPFKVSEYLGRYLTELNINGKKRKRCNELVDELASFANGRNPRTIVGGLIRYVIEEDGCSSKEIADTVGISEYHIRKIERKIKDILENN